MAEITRNESQPEATMESLNKSKSAMTAERKEQATS
jgi:hypothetical protein